LGRTSIGPAEAQQLHAGEVLLLDGNASDPVAVYADGKLIARGEVVVVDDKFGVRVLERVGK
jgi:flagellar motor switch protein FliN